MLEVMVFTKQFEQQKIEKKPVDEKLDLRH